MNIVKPIYVTKPAIPSKSEYYKEISTIFDQDILTNNGPEVQKLSHLLARYLGVRNVSLFVNGHAALVVALMSLGLKGEVITTPFTFASTTHAIVQCGLTPVFCDIQSDDCTMDPTKIEALITDKTCAIVPVHVFGNPCDTEAIEAIAKKHHLKVIYDAAHAFGVRYHDQPIGQYGDVSMFSFHATKVFNTIEGGALAFSDSNLNVPFDENKDFGLQGSVDVETCGINAKMNEFSAAMGVCNLKHVDDSIALRKQICQRYLSNLQKIPGLSFPLPREGTQSNYAYFPMLVQEDDYGMNRDELCDLLVSHQIFPRKYFYPLTSDFPCYHGQFSSSLTPIALATTSHIITLPIYPSLPLASVDRICKIIRNQK